MYVLSCTATVTRRAMVAVHGQWTVTPGPLPIPRDWSDQKETSVDRPPGFRFPAILTRPEGDRCRTVDVHYRSVPYVLSPWLLRLIHGQEFNTV
jgi:hypothetical protein